MAMKLYFSAGACPLASHRRADGADFHAIAPKGQVPLLALANRQRFRAAVGGRPAVREAMQAEGLAVR